MNGRGDGIRNWLIQRISAIYIALFTIYIGYFFLSTELINYQTWYGWVSQTINKILISLFFFTLLMHAWVGIRDVVMDYVHNITIRFILLTAIIGLLAAMAIWLILIVQGVR
ncbi:MAG: succinate dehydrogenase, hydrophobic membrane anchor protein [Gammaproteobacteria bacterium]|nr:succinate dehydrogenase, hydrophobic membrane anchor protein [Gammaproteobacteria bacterium]